MDVKLVEVTDEDMEVLERLAEFYIYDYTDFMDWDIDPDGHFTGLDRNNFIKPGRRTFFIRVDGALAGFATVEHMTQPTGAYGYTMDMYEFFVMRKFRRRGIGRLVARQLFDRFPGKWQVGQLPQNKNAIAFWRRVIGEYTGGHYQEISPENDDNIQYFDNRGTPGTS